MRHLSIGVLAVAAVVAFGGCGSSDSTSTTSSTESAADPASSGLDVQQAKKELDAVVNESATYNLPPLGVAPSKNKNISFMTCPLAICTEVGTGVKEAAAALGWQVRTIPNNFTPAGYKQSWQQIAQNPGDAVITTAPVLPDSAVQTLIDKADVPYVAVTSPSDPAGKKIAVISSLSAIQVDGAVEANWVIQDAGKPVKTLLVYDPSIPSLASVPTGYKDALAKNCPKCSNAELKVSSAKVGPALAQEVVSDLQRNPDVGYVVFGLGDLATGVPAAIEAAGLSDKVKIVVRGATPPNLQDVKSGGIAAAFTDEIFEAGWRAVDKIVRSIAGKPVGETKPPGKIRLITKDNLPADISKPFRIPGYQDGFKKAWGIT